MKTSEKLEIILRGEFTSTRVSIEGTQIPLYRSGKGELCKTYEYFDVLWPLDLSVMLKGGLGKKWEVIVKVGGKTIIHRSGMFVEKRWVTLSGAFQKHGLNDTQHSETAAGYTILSCI